MRSPSPNSWPAEASGGSHTSALRERPDTKDDLAIESARLVTTRVVVAHWRPAQRFWDHFQLCDPVGVMPLHVRTSKLIQGYARAVSDLKKSQPATSGDFAEKLKAAACLGVLQHMGQQERKGPLSAEDRRDLRSSLVNLMTTPALLFLTAVTGGANFREDPMDVTLSPHKGEREVMIMRAYLAAAGNEWNEALDADAARLGWGTAD